MSSPTPGNEKSIAIKSVLSDQLQEYGSLIHSLLTSVIRCSSAATALPSDGELLSSSNSSACQSPQEITQTFLELDKKLKISVSTLIKQKRFQEQIEQLDNQIARVDQCLQSVIRRLHFAEQKLTEVVETARHRAEEAQAAREHPVEVESLLRLARRLGPRTGAPPGWQGEKAKQLTLHTPPYPTFAMISVSSLYYPLPPAFASIDHPPPGASDARSMLHPGKDASLPGTLPPSPRSPPHASSPAYLDSPMSSPLRMSGGALSPGHSPRQSWVNFDLRVSDRKVIDFYLSDSEGSEDSEEGEEESDEDAAD